MIYIIWIYFILINFINGHKQILHPTCRMNLLENERKVGNDQFEASSSWQEDVTTKHNPYHARMTSVVTQIDPTDGRAWCPASMATGKPKEWIQVSFKQAVLVETLFTAGLGSSSNLFTPKLSLQYYRNGRWIQYVESGNITIFDMNADARNKIRRTIRPIIVEKVRLYPIASLDQRVCLKFALIGCKWPNVIGSYSGPDGDAPWSQDVHYDGQKQFGMLYGGLGLLTDNYWWQGGSVDTANRQEQGDVLGWRCTPDRIIRVIFNFTENNVILEVNLYFLSNSVSLQSIHLNLILPHKMIQIPIKTPYSTQSQSPFNIPIPQQFQQPSKAIQIHLQCPSSLINTFILLSEVSFKSRPLQQPTTTTTTTTTTSSNHIKPIIITKQQYPNYKVTERDKSSNGDTKDRTVTLFLIGFSLVILSLLMCCIGGVWFRLRQTKKKANVADKKLQILAHPHIAPSFISTGGTISILSPSKPHPPYLSASTGQLAPLPCYPTTTTLMISPTNVYSGSSSLSTSPPVPVAPLPHSNSDHTTTTNPTLYASWPNTDDDDDVVPGDTTPREDQTRLLGSASVPVSEYATYQRAISPKGDSDQSQMTFTNTSIIPITHSSLKLSLSNHNKQPIKVNPHLTNYLTQYRGICGDVPLRDVSCSWCSNQHTLPNNTNNNNACTNPTKFIPSSSLLHSATLSTSHSGSLLLVHPATDAPQSASSNFTFLLKQLHSQATVTARRELLHELQLFTRLPIQSDHLATLHSVVLDQTSHKDLATTPTDHPNWLNTPFSLLFVPGPHPNTAINLKYYLRHCVDHNTFSEQYKWTVVSHVVNAMSHLEHVGVRHGDLGCRVCTVDPRSGLVRVYAGVGLLDPNVCEDYTQIDLCLNSYDSCVLCALRWMAPEVLCRGEESCKSDVWSFGVLVWEIWNLCSQQPYTSLADSSLLTLFKSQATQPRLTPSTQAHQSSTQPRTSTKQPHTELITHCTQYTPHHRPSFFQIHTSFFTKA